MHQHKSFRLGTEHALCRNRGGRWWIWHKKPFVNSRSPTMNLTRSAVERVRLATCCSGHSASKFIAKHGKTPRDCPRVFTHTYPGTVPKLSAPTKNTIRFEVDPQPEPYQATWAKLSITVERSDGGIVDAEIIRPRSWILRNGICAGRMLPFNLPELEVSGLALLTAIDDCPPIADGESSVVTAWLDTARRAFDPSVKLGQSIRTGRRPMLLWPSRPSFSHFPKTAQRSPRMGAAR